MFEGLPSKVAAGRASSIGDSYTGCIVEDLCPCNEFQRLEDATRVSLSDHRRSLPLSIVLDRRGSARAVS